MKNKTEKMAQKPHRKVNGDDNHILVSEALKITKETVGMAITRKTLLTWARKYNLGRKVGGRYIIYHPRFIEFLNKGFRHA